jgi:uncharacterized protein YjdB
MMTILRFLALAASLSLAAACGEAGYGSPRTVPVAVVVVQPDSVTLAVGQSRRLLAAVMGRDGRVLQERTVVWLSDDDSIVSVDAAGNAAALRAGVVALIAMSSGKAGRATVRVRDPATEREAEGNAPTRPGENPE